MLTILLHKRTLETLNRADHEDESQERLQHSLGTEPPSSPWSLTADPDEMLSDCMESFGSSGMDGTSDDSREPSVSIRNNEYHDADSPDLFLWEDDTDQAAEPLDTFTVPRPDTQARNLVDLVSFEYSETSQAVPESRTFCAEPHQVSEKPIESCERIGIQSRPASSVSFNVPSIKPPSILVSNDTVDEISNAKTRDLPESHNSPTLRTGQIGMERYRYKSMASNQRSRLHPDLNQPIPNNYEIFMYDRQHSSIPGRIDPQSEKTAADNLQAFCADADLTAADIADATHDTDTNLLHVKKRRLSAKVPVSGTLTNHFPSSRHLQTSACSSRVPSPFQNHLQPPTPPPSFRYQPTDEHPATTYARGITPMSQATTSRSSPIVPLSPISPSASGSPEAATCFTSCPVCPNTVFKGTPANQKNSLKRHNRDHHSGMPPLECLVDGCTATFAPGRKDNRIKHVGAMHPDHPLPPSTKRKRKS